MKERGDEVQVFLEALFGAKPDGLYILIWTFPNKRSHWFRTLDKAVTYVKSLNGCNVYVGVGLSPSDFGEHCRCESQRIAGISAFAADIDLHSEAHAKGVRPSTIEQALSILPPALAPTIIIETGNGVQCWWLFKEPWIFENDEERQRAATLSSRWQTALKYAAQRNGWTFERLGDLARVLRIPGTQNVKDPGHPKNVTILKITDQRYSPSKFLRYLDDLAIPDEDEKARQSKVWEARLGDKTLIIDLAAAIPAEKLTRWMEQDRFLKTWKHQRTDMQDLSQTGYDLALANFGVRNGLGDQEIVDLIIHNRRIHGRTQSQSLQYYQRTISKAANGGGELNTSFEESATPNSAGLYSSHTTIESPLSGTTTGAADPNAKAKLCELISGILGVGILRIVKVTGKDPVYFMDLEQGRIEIPNVGNLISQRFMKQILAGQVGRIIPDFKPPRWKQLAQTMLDACITEQGTDDLDLKGQARIYITDYLSENPFIGTPDGQKGRCQRKPMIYEGKIAISASDLRTYINTTAMENHSVKSIASMIAALGAKSIRLRGNFKEQSRWALPVEEFDPKDYGEQYRESNDRAE